MRIFPPLKKNQQFLLSPLEVPQNNLDFLFLYKLEIAKGVSTKTLGEEIFQK